jgi:hypothetical protein
MMLTPVSTNVTSMQHTHKHSSRTRKVLAGLIAAVGLTAGGLAAAGTVGATVVNPTSGAAAETGGACVTNSFTGNRLMKVVVGQYGFDYSRAYIYDYATGTGGWEQWSPIFQGNSDFTRVAYGYKAIYLQFADYLGNGQWTYSGEWVSFGNSWFCG